jgi:hypothetical protein
LFAAIIVPRGQFGLDLFPDQTPRKKETGEHLPKKLWSAISGNHRMANVWTDII